MYGCMASIDLVTNKQEIEDWFSTQRPPRPPPKKIFFEILDLTKESRSRVYSLSVTIGEIFLTGYIASIIDLEMNNL